MAVAHHLLVLLHLVAFAALLGGSLVQLRSRDPEISTAMLHGAWVGLASGAALWVLADTFDVPVSLTAMIVKTAVAAFRHVAGRAQPAVLLDPARDAAADHVARARRGGRRGVLVSRVLVSGVLVSGVLVRAELSAQGMMAVVVPAADVREGAR